MKHIIYSLLLTIFIAYSVSFYWIFIEEWWSIFGLIGFGLIGWISSEFVKNKLN
jgi:hypothetical protein